MVVKELVEIASEFTTAIEDITHIFTKGINYKEDLHTGIKVADYYLSAIRARDVHKDLLVYNYLRRRAISAYGRLKEDESKQFVLKFIDKDFLQT